MKHDAFDKFLEDQTLPKNGEERELALLLQEVSELDVPDPGQEYWNQFNHRLQTRIDQRPKRKRWIRLLRPGLALAVSVLVFALIWPRSETPTAVPSLANLDSEHLEIIGDMYVADFWAGSEEMGDSDFSQLLDISETLFEDPFSGTSPFEESEWSTDEG